MTTLVTGSSGHLGEALVRVLRERQQGVRGIDIKPSPYTERVGSIVDRDFVRQCMTGVDAVLHTATLHKPHVGTHSRLDFIDTNVSGTLNLLEQAAAAGVSAFIFTSTTSTFGDAMRPQPDEPAVWVTEQLGVRPKNIYGITKVAAEQLCQLFHRKQGLPCVVLRTSRFFPEDDDDRGQRNAYCNDNLKVNELLYRRADIADMASAHLQAVERAPALGFDRFIISATPPFDRADAPALNRDAPAIVARHFPDYVDEYQRRGWSMVPTIGRVYDNAHARAKLDWSPRWNFSHALQRLRDDGDYRSQLAIDVGKKGYHDVVFEDGPYPVDD